MTNPARMTAQPSTPPTGPAEWTPQHYRGDGLQPFDIINAFNLDFYEGNALKYLLRWRKKNGVEDLCKARTYLQVLIDRETPGAAAMTDVAPGGNAEDCPRCAGTNPDYPFLCPGHPATDTASSDPAFCGNTTRHPAHRFMRGEQVGQCPGSAARACGEECTEGHVYAGRCALATHPDPTEHGPDWDPITGDRTWDDVKDHQFTGLGIDTLVAELAADATTRHVGTSTIGEPATADDGLREQYAAAIRAKVDGTEGCADGHRLADAVLAVRDRRIEQLTARAEGVERSVQLLTTDLLKVAQQRDQAEAERDKALAAFNAVTLELEDAKAINAEACQLIDMQKELIGTERRIVMTAMSHREDQGARIEHCDHCGRDHMGELDEAIQAADVSFAKAFPASADGPRRPGRLPDEGPQAPAGEPETDAALAEWRSAAKSALKEVERQTARADDAEAAIARVRDLIADMRGTTGARTWADWLDTALDGPADTSPPTEPSPDSDTCRPLEINGDTIRVHGSRDLTDQERSYASDIVEAAKRRFAAEQAQPADRPRCPNCGLPHNLTPGSRPVSLCQRLRDRIAAEPDPVEAQPELQQRRADGDAARLDAMDRTEHADLNRHHLRPTEETP